VRTPATCRTPGIAGLARYQPGDPHAPADHHARLLLGGHRDRVFHDRAPAGHEPQRIITRARLAVSQGRRQGRQRIDPDAARRQQPTGHVGQLLAADLPEPGKQIVAELGDTLALPGLPRLTGRRRDATGSAFTTVT
jgi:hypothetical protein